MTRAAAGDPNDQTVIERRDPLVGALLDQRFRIDFQLAAGGFGAIYRATDVLSDAEVALKVLLPRVARDPAVVERFRREGKTLANLRDPHTITAYELGEAPDGTLYIVMELLHGESLYQQFRRHGPLPWRRVVHIARGVCSSLAEAHAAGIVHRDLKPANIHLETCGNDADFVKVLDFGIAKIVQGSGPEYNELTQAGTMIGTVDYMSPEQMVGGEMTPGSDIYTLGIVMYEMISGRTPFADAQTATAILAAVLTQAPDPLSSHVEVPRALDQIVARCLEREPNHRFAEITELAEALAELVAGPVLRPSPGIPATGFDQVALTNDATRIDVRYTESLQPVLDARGPRYRPRDALLAIPAVVPQPQVAPVVGGRAAASPPARPAHAIGSQYMIAARGPEPVSDGHGSQPVSDGHGSQPIIGLAAWQRPQHWQAEPEQAGSLQFGPAQHGPAHHGSAHAGPVHLGPGHVGASHLGPGHIGAPHLGPGHVGPAHLGPAHLGQAGPVHHGQIQAGGAPPVQASRYAARSSYDMAAAAIHDAMVRRIIWAVLFVVAIIAVVVLTR